MLAGALANQLGTDVNEVNAPVVAEERGIEVVEETNRAPHDFVSTVGLKIEGDAGASTEVIGALFGSGEPRIVGVNGLRLEIVPEGHLLVTVHQDRPGIIGGIGTILGKRDVNISRMVLGIFPGATRLARAAISVDGAVPADVVRELSSISGIEEVRAARFD